MNKKGLKDILIENTASNYSIDRNLVHVFGLSQNISLFVRNH